MSKPWFFAPAPAARLAAVRVLVGGYALGFLLVWGVNLARYATFPKARFVPVGLATALPGPLEPWTFYLILGATVLLAVPFLLGWRFRVTGPLFAIGLLLTLTYRHSWGMIFHTENLFCLHVIVLAGSGAAHSYAIDAQEAPTDHARYGWPLKLMAIIVISAYLLAGIAKIKNSGWGWADGEVLRVQVAFDNVRKIEHGAMHSRVGAWAVQHDWIFGPLAVISLMIELGAPLALLNRRLAAVWIGAIWMFHAGVLALMFIIFAYPLSGVAFAPMLRAERIWQTRLGRWLGQTAINSTRIPPGT